VRNSSLVVKRCIREDLVVINCGSREPAGWRPSTSKKRNRVGWVRLVGPLLGLAMAMVSCNNDKVEVYLIPKEAINVAMQSGSAGLPPPPGAPAQWTRPDGWSDQPLSEMRLGSFKVDGPNATSADVSVIAFPGEAGGLISNINRWRGQLQLAPLDEDQLRQMIQRTEVDSVPTYLVDFQSA